MGWFTFAWAAYFPPTRLGKWLKMDITIQPSNWKLPSSAYLKRRTRNTYTTCWGSLLWIPFSQNLWLEILWRANKISTVCSKKHKRHSSTAPPTIPSLMLMVYHQHVPNCTSWIRKCKLLLAENWHFANNWMLSWCPNWPRCSQGRIPLYSWFNKRLIFFWGGQKVTWLLVLGSSQKSGKIWAGSHPIGQTHFGQSWDPPKRQNVLPTSHAKKISWF